MSIHNDGTMDVLVNGRMTKRTCEFIPEARRYVPDIKNAEVLSFPFGALVPHIVTAKDSE